jgi:hypothetical protein
MTQETNGTIVSLEVFTSMVVYKIKTAKGIFDYTTFGNGEDMMTEGDKLCVGMGFSVHLGAFTIKYILNRSLKKAA